MDCSIPSTKEGLGERIGSPNRKRDRLRDSSKEDGTSADAHVCSKP